MGSPIAIFRILISTRKLIDCIQTKEMRTHVSCMTYVDNTGEVWTSDDAGGVISIRSARSGRTKETIDLDGDKVTSMSVFGEQVHFFFFLFSFSLNPPLPLPLTPSPPGSLWDLQRLYYRF